MELRAYLDRIEFLGPVEPTLSCLTAIHRQQAFTVPYESIDIMLGRHVDRDCKRIFDKVVRKRRGGWCYELHELLVWALREIGFDVRLVTAGIHRREFGDVKLGNHTAVLVTLADQIYLCDLGLGDGIRDPIPLIEGEYLQGRLRFGLERTEDGYWRFLNHSFAFPMNFDFKDEPLDEGLIDRFSDEYRSAPDSMYLMNLAIQIMQPETVTCLTGRVIRQKSSDGTAKRLIQEGEFEQVVADLFGIRDKDMAWLWEKVEARHRALFGDKPIEELNISDF